MGSSTSKAARTFPKSKAPAWSGARAPRLDDAPQQTLAAEHKSKAIQDDAGDPHFLANLNRLGAVRVDRYAQTVHQKQEVSNTNRLFQSRTESEEDAVSMQPTRNRLRAATLSELLDARKGARTTHDLETLAEKYGIDKQKMEKLATFVTTPSVGGGSATRTVGKDGDESLTTTAVWVYPSMQDA